VNIAAIGDLHCQTDSQGQIRELLQGAAQAAEVLVLAGDLTNRGMIEEMEVLLAELKRLTLPVVAVLGNHDHELEHAELLIKMMESDGIHVLESTSCVIQGVGFVGTKGFCGGFGAHRIQPFGEKAIKDFVNTSVREVLQMEKALEQLGTRRKVGVIHYAPIRETLHGESAELFPFLGSSLIGDAFDRYGVDVVFHGHAHNGAPFGRTPKEIPVYNVSRFVRIRLGKLPFLIYDLDEPA
jgi:uncharacterized protein